MLNKFYFEEQLILELQADKKDALSDPSQATINNKTTS